MKHAWPLVFAALFAFAGRAGPDYVPPRVDAPAAWIEPVPSAAAAPDAWWTSFGDPLLVELVQRAARENRDARIAIARLRAARAEHGVAAAQLGPKVDADGSYSKSRLSENGFLKGFGASDGSLPGAIAPGQEIDLWQAGLDASWELDLFGGNRRALEAARADVDATQLELDDVLLAMVSDVAGRYVELRALQGRLAIARADAQLLEDTLSIVREQAAAGVASGFDVARAETQVATSQARVPDLDAAVRVTIRGLELLVGAQPGALDAELDPARPIPVVPDAFGVSIPVEVLRRRPDVRLAERRLAAATARIGVAEADLYPRFSLTGSFGLQSQELASLPEYDSRFFAIGPSVRWPLFDMGRVRARIAVQDARALEAEGRFEKAVLSALADTESALVRMARAGKSRDQRVRARDAARRAVEIARSLYSNGVLEFLELLDAERTLEDAEDAALVADAAIAADGVALFRALGGGWESARGLMSQED